MIDKQQLIQQIVCKLEEQLSQAQHAANQAHLAAIDDQSIAETQYDTLAIESAYLAHGHSKRVTELKQAIQQLSNLSIIEFTDSFAIVVGAIISIKDQLASTQHYFLSPAAGGLSIMLNQQKIQIISPQSPLGNALVGLYQDDEFQLNIAGTNKQYQIVLVK